jgi:hypothetical protein
MCVIKPWTKTQMLSVSGVGELKFDKYRELFLGCVRKFMGQELSFGPDARLFMDDDADGTAMKRLAIKSVEERLAQKGCLDIKIFNGRARKCKTHIRIQYGYVIIRQICNRLYKETYGFSTKIIIIFPENYFTRF